MNSLSELLFAKRINDDVDESHQPTVVFFDEQKYSPRASIVKLTSEKKINVVANAGLLYWVVGT
jgi:hypothetical protein